MVVAVGVEDIAVIVELVEVDGTAVVGNDDIADIVELVEMD